MAKERMITRTVKGYNVTWKALVIETESIELRNGVFGIDFNPEKAKECIRKRYGEETETVFKVVSIEEFMMLYGVTENNFMFYAKELPARGEGGRTKERMVTRTIESYKVTALCVDIPSEECYDREYNMDITWRKDKPEKALEQLRAMWETSRTAIAKIKKVETEKKLYGMSEEQFMQIAVELPPRSASEENDN